MTRTTKRRPLLRSNSLLLFASGLLLATPVPHAAAQDLLALPEGRVMGKAIDESGNAWIAVQSPPDGGETHVTLWRGDKSQTIALGTRNVKYARPLSDSHFVIWDCLPLFEGDNHCDFSYRLYRVTDSGTLEFRGELDPFQHPYPNVVFSADASMWGATTYRFDDSTRLAVGRNFTFGTTSPATIKRERTVAFPPAKAERSSTDYDDNNFILIDAAGPVVLVPYGEHLHLLRFGDDSIDRLRPDQLTSARRYSGSRGIWPGYNAIWQPDDRLLWILDRDSGAWLAYDLTALGTEWTFPVDPSLRREGGGRPHQTRGYMRIISDGGRHRIEHVWQGLGLGSTSVRNVSDWLNGPARQYRWPLPLYGDGPAVSGNGRHALVIEEDSSTSAPGTRRNLARRLELSPASSEATDVRRQQ